MNTTKLSSTADPARLESLNGKSILVAPGHSTHNPPTGVRGTILISPDRVDSAARPRVEIVVTLPDTATSPARKITIFLSELDIERLLHVEADGKLTFYYEGSLD